MKILFVFISVLLLDLAHVRQAVSQETKLGWYQQSAGVSHTLGNVQFTSRDTGYTAGGDHFYRTTNGGETWMPFGPPDVGTGWGHFFFLNSGIGWVNGLTVLYYTEDAGETWTERALPSSARRINFVNKDTGWGIGGRGGGTGWCRTYDGGKTWYNAGVGPGNGAIFDLVVFDSKHMLGVGETYPLVTDGCASLVYDSLGFPRRPPNVCLEAAFSGIDNLDSTTAIMFGGDGIPNSDVIHVYRTENRGFGWNSSKYLPAGRAGVAIDFSDNLNGTAVGKAGAIGRTTDGGLTWEAQTSPVIENLNSVHFIDSLNGAAVGDKGLILHTTNAGKLWVQQFLPTSLNSHVTPQPFATKTTIAYELPKAVRVTVRIYDGLGKEMQTISEPGVQDAGLHSVEFDGSAFSNEVFYYRIEAYPYVGTGKFTKVPF